MTSNVEKSDGLVHYSVKNTAVIVKESRKFELACLKKKKKKKKKKEEEEEEEERKTFWLSGDFLVRYFGNAF